MNIDNFKSEKIVVEIRTFEGEKIINELLSQNIDLIKVKKLDKVTIKIKINHKDYNVMEELVKRENGKIKIVSRIGIKSSVSRVKRNIFLVLGVVIFFGIIYYLSNYIWVIDIQVQKNIAPFEIRENLKEIGIKPGILKSKIDVSDIEKKVENKNSEVLWIRARVEGSALKILVEEKINPPSEVNVNYGNLVAERKGEVFKVYTYAGKSVVEKGDVVDVGDVLIKGIDGMEGREYLIQPRGQVIANTFYEKEMVVDLNHEEVKRSGKVDKDIYIEIFGKKLYLKKFTKDFIEYDKIEKNNKILKQTIYYENIKNKVTLTKEEAQDMAVKNLENALIENLPIDAKIKERIVTNEVDSSDKNKIKVKVVFVVEQNILNEKPISY